MNDKKFVISTHGFDMGIGGLKVLHRLCHLLNENGYDAYLVPYNFDIPFVVYDKYNVKIVTHDILNNLQDAIVIYPQGWHGNYLNAPNVVRWILGFPPAGDHLKSWNDNDLWFWYQPGYKIGPDAKHTDNDLYVAEQHRDVFYDMQLPRDGSCWTLRKAQELITPDQYTHPNDGTFISYHDAANIMKLSKLFNTKEIFYCYDNYTYMTIQSLMCNTDCIVIPHTLSHDEFINGHELNKYVAYGIEDLSRAKSIRNEFNDHLIDIENKTKKQIHQFVNKCYDYFK